MIYNNLPEDIGWVYIGKKVCAVYSVDGGPCSNVQVFISLPLLVKGGKMSYKKKVICVSDLPQN